MTLLHQFLFLLLCWSSILHAREVSGEDLPEIIDKMEPIIYLEKIVLYYGDQQRPFTQRQQKLLRSLSQKVSDLPIYLLIESYNIKSVLDDTKQREVSDYKYKELLQLFTHAKGLPEDKILYFYAGKENMGVFGAQKLKGKVAELVISFIREKDSAVDLQELLKEFRQRGFDVSMVRSSTPVHEAQTETPESIDIHKKSQNDIHIGISFPKSIALKDAEKRDKGIGFLSEFFLFNHPEWGLNFGYRGFDYKESQERVAEFQIGGIYRQQLADLEFALIDLNHNINMTTSQFSALTSTTFPQGKGVQRSSEIGVNLVERLNISFLIPGLSYHPLTSFEVKFARSYIDLSLNIGLSFTW